MNLDRVTITGADDSIKPQELLRLTQKYPFVEWGILVSRSNSGVPRFPSIRWLGELENLAMRNPDMTLSLHICGGWVRELLLGQLTALTPDLFIFDRVQLNFHAEKVPCNPKAFYDNLLRIQGAFSPQFIFQDDGAAGNKHMADVLDQDEKGLLDAATLFDHSGGAGVLPSGWPEPPDHADYYGYAGGLGPDTLEKQFPLIAKVAGEKKFWIDMETGVRSDYDRQFDLKKVEKCLDYAAPLVVGYDPL